eukprot:9865842-Alexandrium_andersonii.AAC.1
MARSTLVLRMGSHHAPVRSEPALPRAVALFYPRVEGMGGSAGGVGPERLFEPGLLEERARARRQGLDVPFRNRVGLGTARGR